MNRGKVTFRQVGHDVPADPEASIVIAAYRVTRYIKECVESALAQTDVRVEVILVDDGSEEDLCVVLGDALLDRIVFLRQANAGRSLARNTGILAARSPYVVLLDGDDKLEPGHCSTTLAALRASEEVGVVVPDALMFGDGPRAGRRLSEVSSRREPISFETFMSGSSALVGASVFRRSALMAVNGFDPSLPMVEDLELHARLLLNGVRYRYSPPPTYLYRRHRDASTVHDLSTLHRWTLAALDLVAVQPMPDTCREALLAKRRRTQSDLSLALGEAAIHRRQWAAASTALSAVDWRYSPSFKHAVKWRTLRVFSSVAAHVFPSAGRD